MAHDIKKMFQKDADLTTTEAEDSSDRLQRRIRNRARARGNIASTGRGGRSEKPWSVIYYLEREEKHRRGSPDSIVSSKGRALQLG